MEKLNLMDKMDNIMVDNLLTAGGNVAQEQIVVTVGNLRKFISYDTDIAYYNIDTEQLDVTGDWEYSNTTMKYFKQFMEDYTMHDYVSAKNFRQELKDNEKIRLV